MPRRPLAAALAAASLACAASARAEPPDCTPPAVRPADELLRNAGGFRVVAGIGGDDPEVVVRRAGDAEPLRTRVAGFHHVRIDDELAVGDVLEIMLRDGCAARERPVEARLRVVADAPRPSALGDVAISAQREGEIPLPLLEGCLIDEREPAFGVYRVVELAPDPAARPWLPLLPIALRVGEGAAAGAVALEGDDPAAPARFLVYARCDGGADGLGEGEHALAFEALGEALGLGMRTRAARTTLRCTESARRTIEEARDAAARDALFRDVERAVIRVGPYALAVLGVVASVAAFRRRRRSRGWPGEG